MEKAQKLVFIMKRSPKLGLFYPKTCEIAIERRTPEKRPHAHCTHVSKAFSHTHRTRVRVRILFRNSQFGKWLRNGGISKIFFFHLHFQVRNSKISPILHFDLVNNGRIVINCVLIPSDETKETLEMDLQFFTAIRNCRCQRLTLHQS